MLKACAYTCTLALVCELILCVNVSMHACGCVHTHTHAHTCAFLCAHVQTYIHIYTHTICMHICVHVWV